MMRDGGGMVVLGVEFVSMVVCVCLFMYPSETFRFLRWFIIERTFKSVVLASQSPKSTNRKSIPTTQGRGHESHPLLDATDSSVDGDDHSSYLIQGSPRSDRIPSDVVSRRLCISPPGSNKKQQLRKRRDCVSFGRIPEPNVWSSSQPGFQQTSSSSTWNLANSFSAEEEEVHDDDDVTVCRSNSSIREVSSQASPCNDNPSTETLATMTTTTTTDPVVRTSWNNIGRSIGPIPAAVLKSNLAQVKLPARFQRCNAISSSTLLKTCQLNLRGSSSSAPSSSAPSSTCQLKEAAASRGNRPSSFTTARSTTRASLSNLEGMEESPTSSTISISGTEVGGGGGGPTPIVDTTRITTSTREWPRSSLEQREGGSAVPHPSRYDRHHHHHHARIHSDGASKHSVEDHRLLQRMMRSVRPDKFGALAGSA